ncbi:MAG: hypothetical protein ACI9X0_000162 [Kiritimatiellia bacterium]|jgi:hypothetical protein
MEQSNNVRKCGGGKHFTSEERIRLETLDRTLYPGKKNPNFSELGRRLGRHRTSVSREYRRGTVMNKNTQLEEFQVYSAAKGGAVARKAALDKGPRGKLTNRIAADISGLIIKEKLSPYAALVRLRKSAQHAWLPCERTVYSAIDAGLLGVSRPQLPYKRAAQNLGRRRGGEWLTPTPAGAPSPNAHPMPKTGNSTVTGRWIPLSEEPAPHRHASLSLPNECLAGKSSVRSPQGLKMQSSPHSTAWNADPTVSLQP